MMHPLEQHSSLTRRSKANKAAIAAVAMMLAGVVAQASAAELYRWTEPDGSITYSPTPPSAGIDFEVVDTASIGGQVNPVDSPVGPDAGAPATSLADSVQTDSPENEAGLAYAPSPGSADINPDSGITAAAPIKPTADNAKSTTTAADNTASSTYTASDSKRSQCLELEKRVVSLERRLKSPLTPEEMDNTVIYMARYQQSVNSHCRS